MSLFPRLNKQRSVEVDPHDWDLASKDHVRKFGFSSKHPKTVIPDTAIFSDAIVPALKVAENSIQTKYPNPGHLAAHLGLLECFRKFKDGVCTAGHLDVLDLPSYPGTEDAGPSIRAESPSVANSQRWDTLVQLSVARFQLWFENIESTLRHAAAYHRFGPDSNALHAAMTANYLPPLDVLLVWYAYMQNPGHYRRDNLAHSSPKLLEIPLPWEAILAVMDLDSFNYNLPPAACTLFTTVTTQSADISTYLLQPPPYTNLNPEKAFSLDLAAAVHELIDGESFAKSMSSYLWLRSPSLEGTLLRALAKYGALAQATSNIPKVWLERVREDPTLQLVWRTHMLYPMAYIEFSAKTFGSDVLLTFGDLTSEEQESSDAKIPVPATPTSINDDTSIDVADVCYCWICERIRDEDPNYAVSRSGTTQRTIFSGSPVSQPASPVARSFPRLRSSSTSSPSLADADSSLLALNKEQLASVKADVAFYRFVQDFRQVNPRCTLLPTRPLTEREIEKGKRDREARDRAGTYHGTGYTVEVVRPAVYDKVTGRLLKKEKTKVTRSKNSLPTGRRVMAFMSF